ncbi:MAG TPA: hypothetical protein VFD30_07530 [Terriglobia bacterium]|nr:hypothetical protein [Terriglobia bacterium]
MRTRVLLWIVIFGLWASPTLRATTLVRLSLEQLTQASTAIVQGRVVSQESRWNPEHTRILTYTTIAVNQPIKGNPPATLVIEQPGGKIGNIHTFVAGSVRFRPQIEYMLFLEPSSRDMSQYLVVGMMQGALRIYRDAETHQQRVILPLGKITHLARKGAATTSIQGPTVPLNEIRQQIASSLQAPIVIPTGVSLPVSIVSTESLGVGRLRVVGRTTSDIFPSPSVVVPAGSLIEGAAQRVGNMWAIRWNEVTIRTVRVPLSATSQESAGGTLRGRPVLAKVR